MHKDEDLFAKEDQTKSQEGKYMSKFICMLKGCNFIAEDIDEAKSHMEIGGDHLMVEVVRGDNGNVDCHIM